MYLILSFILQSLATNVSWLLWTYFRNLIEWSDPEQRMNMAINWEHFLGGIAHVAATDETIWRIMIFVDIHSCFKSI